MSEEKKSAIIVVLVVFAVALIYQRSKASTASIGRHRVNRRTGGSGVDPHDETIYNAASVAGLAGLLV